MKLSVAESKKQGTYFMLSPETKEKIKVIANENHLSQANAISLMVDAYFESREEEHALLKQTLSNLLDEKLGFMKEKMNRIQVASNVIDRDTKIILEFLNHYYLVNKFQNLITTEEYKTNGMEQAEQLIQKRIHKQRKKKLEHLRQANSRIILTIWIVKMQNEMWKSIMHQTMRMTLICSISSWIIWMMIRNKENYLQQIKII